jgi:hypothetical protein
MLELIDGNTEIWEIVETAHDLMEFVIGTHNIQTFDEFRCPYMKALAKSLYVEVEDDGRNK